MSIQSEINRLNSAKTAISNAIQSRGVDVPTGTSIDGMAELIQKIPTFFTYKATYLVSDWTYNNTRGLYYQSAVVTSVDGGPTLTSENAFLSAPYTTSTTSPSTNETLAQALSIINTGEINVTEAGSTSMGIGIFVATKPSCDITVYWFGREISE